MGVAGLWDILKPAAETRSMTHLAITNGFLANPQGLRGFRIGIDASIWFFHAEYGREGENPVLRTLFFRCATLMKTTFLPLFVFDGPKRPDFKRGKKINRTGHKLIPGMKAIIEAFGFEWRMAPAEAEAELAYLNRAGIIDGILSDDVDNFLFGATTVVRNISNNLSGNRANPILNSQGKDDKNHTRLYQASKILSHRSVSLTRGGLILIGLLSGGDYAQAGLPGCGITTAHALAKCGFGDSLLEAATTMPRESLPTFLSTWRQQLREELRTNSRGIIGRKLGKLAKEVPDSFPDVDILLSYTNPITSESLGRAAEKNMKLTWRKEPDVGKLAALCEFYFEWGYKEAIITRFRTLLWHSIVLRVLRRAVINADDLTSGFVSDLPATPSKLIAKQFASLNLLTPSSHDVNSEDEDEDPLIIKIHSSRSHASTDGLLEYRLEISPVQLVRLAEAGIKGIREPPEKDEWASDEATADDDDSDSGKKSKEPRLPPDPSSHLRLWLPACMVEIAEPGVVKEFKEREGKKAAKKSGKRRKEPGMKTPQRSKNGKINAVKQSLYQSEDEECQVIDIMLSRSPTRISNTRKTKYQPPQREESEESGLEIAITNLPRPQNHTISILESLSILDASRRSAGTPSPDAQSRGHSKAPAPFPISLVDDDVFSSSDALVLPSLPRQRDRTRESGSPHRYLRCTGELDLNNRPVSPSPMRPAGKLRAADVSIIELSSDDGDDSESIPLTKFSGNVLPLILAKAKATKSQAAMVHQASTVQRTLIDLT